jgi:hypothetical protein
MHARLRSLRLASLPLALALAAGSCGDSPTAPGGASAHPPVYRSVTAVLRDSLGAPIEGASTRWISPVQANGLVEIRLAETHAGGVDSQLLWDGVWTVVASFGSGASGAQFTVAGPERAESDTQQVDLVGHTASSASGTCVIAGRTDHSGTFVSGLFPGVAVTGADGAWSLAGIPLGHWTVTMQHAGYKTGIVSLDVTAPGSAIAAPTVRLDSDPLP